MEFAWNAEQLEYKNAAIRFAQKELNTGVTEREREENFSSDLWRKCADFGVLLRELHEISPDLKRCLPEIKLVEDVHVIPNYSYQVRDFCGKGFLCIGDTHRFVDPIFSFGLSGALREAQFAAPASCGSKPTQPCSAISMPPAPLTKRAEWRTVELRRT